MKATIAASGYFCIFWFQLQVEQRSMYPLQGFVCCSELVEGPHRFGEGFRKQSHYLKMVSDGLSIRGQVAGIHRRHELGFGIAQSVLDSWRQPTVVVVFLDCSFPVSFGRHFCVCETIGSYLHTSPQTESGIFPHTARPAL